MEVSRKDQFFLRVDDLGDSTFGRFAAVVGDRAEKHLGHQRVEEPTQVLYTVGEDGEDCLEEPSRFFRVGEDCIEAKCEHGNT